MKELDFFDALKELKLGQVMIQLTKTEYPYLSVGTTLHWDENNHCMLKNFNTNNFIDICYTDKHRTKWIIRDKKDL